MIAVNLLKAEFVKNNYTQKDVADLLGISTKTLYNKLKCGDLGCEEAQILVEKLNIKNPTEIFFAQEVT